MSATAHAGIEDFSVYRAGYTQKRDQKPRTYAVVFKIAAYDAAQKDLHQSNRHLVNFSCRMVLEWREREHGDVEEAVRVDRMAQEALRRCGLYKFWCLGGLRAKPGLLQMLVDYWDPDSESFWLDGMSLTIEVEDIYFITGLSRRGEMVNLHARGGLGHGLTIDEYIAVYYYPETEKVGSQVPTNAIQVLGLKANYY